MTSPHQVTKDFERALCTYTGAPYAVAVTSCTMALLLACAWFQHKRREGNWADAPRIVEIPKRTYVSVPMSIKHAGWEVSFRDEEWKGWYRLDPLPVVDAARWLSGGMYRTDWGTTVSPMVCVSFHWSKTLGVQQGGAILLDDYEADQWLRRARFDGRTEGVPPKHDEFKQLGWHCYLSPEVSASALMRLSLLPKQNDPLPNDDYPDLSKLEIFQ